MATWYIIFMYIYCNGIVISNIIFNLINLKTFNLGALIILTNTQEFS